MTVISLNAKNLTEEEIILLEKGRTIKTKFGSIRQSTEYEILKHLELLTRQGRKKSPGHYYVTWMP
jgi:hypothetical protein